MFNFGAFAGGLANAIQTQQKLNLEEKKYDDDIKASNAKLKQEENKALAEILKQVDEHNKNVSNLSLGMSKAEDETQYNTYASELKAANENFKANAKSQLDNYANTPLGQKMETLFNGARVSDAEQIEKTTIKDANGNVVETYIPQSLVQDKDNLVLMENGRFGIAQVGQDGKISGYQPTNIAPVKFKEDKITSIEMYNLTSPDGKVFKNTPLTAQETIDYRDKGYSFEKVYKPDRIINMGDKNPTAYSSVQVSSLPAVEQDILSKAGYSPTDNITMQDKSRIIGYENKPDAKTTYGDVMIESWKKAVEGGYDGSLAQFKAEEEAKGAASGAAVKADTTITKAEQAKNKILGGKNIVDLEPGSKEETQLDNFFKLKVIENKKDLFSAKDKEILSAAPVLHENLKRMTSGKADDVSGFADNIISNIKTFTGMGMNVEEEAKIKSTMEQMGYSMARNMSGAGVLSNTDVKNGSKAVGSLWESDKALAGKLQGLVENTVTNLKAIRNRDTTDKDAFDLYYGKTLKSFESLAEGLKNPKDKILSKDEILGVKPNSNNTLPPLDINKFKK